MLKIFLLFTSFLIAVFSNAQIEQDGWRDYLSYTNATKVAVAQEKIYCVTDGGLFYFDTEDNSINKLSSFNGLSDFGVQTIAYSRQNNVLIVAYQNSNIDLVFEDGVVNLSDIKRKTMTGDKSVNNITITENEAYLSCGFGIVVLDLTRHEIKDTYFIGENGSPTLVNDVAVHDQFIYAATNQGILKADQNDNLLNYNNWIKVEDIPRNDSKFSHLAVFGNQLIANYTPDQWYQDEMYTFDGGDWEPFLPEIKYAHDIQRNDDYLIVSSRNDVFFIDSGNNIAGRINSYQINGSQTYPIRPTSAGIAEDGTIWIADYENSLVRVSGNTAESMHPNGPLDNSVFNLYFEHGKLWVLPGGRSDSWNNAWMPPHFQIYNDHNWEYFTEVDYPVFDEFFDMVEVATDPADPEHFFIGSWGGGLLEFQNRELKNHYTNFNSPLETALPENPTEPYTRIGGLDFDSEGNLWVVNSQVAENLLKLTPGGDWETFALPEVANNYQVGDVLVTQNDDKWILAPRGYDAYVVDETGDEIKRLLVTSYFNNGENEIFNRMNDVYSIAEDNDGAIWIGTSKGIAVYNNPRQIWDSEVFYAVQPSLDLNDGIYHPLLETETVTAIAVDGANRKWLGTSNSGIYLVSENGDAEIEHFTAENSPLLSNTITSVAIDNNSGEVFIGTDQGLISYQGGAPEGKDSFADVYVYPNPIRENYDGPVTVAGLMEQTDVKITDISGNLVFKTTSFGGKAVWDGNNLNGNRVKTGVYLVFCNDKNGEETHITKLLFIN